MSILGAAGITAGASLLGNLLGSKSQSDANKTNYRIAQMNNEFNERMMEKAMAYNSAEQQVERYKKAGLNPYLMMSGQGAGSVSAATSSGNPQMQAFKPDFSGIGQAAQDYVTNKMQEAHNNATIANMNEDTMTKKIENRLREQKLMSEISQNIANAKNIKARTFYQKMQNYYAKDMMNADYQGKLLQNMTQEHVKQGIIIDNLLKQNELQVFPERFRLQVAEAVSRINLQDKNADKAVADTLLQQANTAKVKLDTKTAYRMADALVDKAKLDVTRGMGLQDGTATLFFLLGKRIKSLFK